MRIPHVCERCGYPWYSNAETAPKKCPSCYTPYWNIPRGQLKRGRPKKVSVHHTSKTNEWYTPDEVITYVKYLYETIDLDPCTNSKTNPNVKATAYFDIFDNGLEKDWFGSVYVNPPYGREIGKWVDKCLHEYASNHVEEILLLAPARVDTKWFAKIAGFHWCSISGRLKFKSSSGERNPAPFPSAMIYIGYRPEEFDIVFCDLGRIYKP